LSYFKVIFNIFVHIVYLSKLSVTCWYEIKIHNANSLKN